MLIPADTLQILIDRAAAAQQVAARSLEYQRQGDMESAHFVELPPEKQATAYAREAIEDATEAARIGDVAGVRQGIRTAVEKAVYQGAQLVRPARPVPRRRVRQ